MAQDQWWKGAVFYQIYPRSFKDSNQDGIGDLQGITQNISHIKSLGVEGVWLSPFFQSPMKDFGYDISNYMAVDPIFGSEQDFNDLIKALRAQDLKIIIDQVYSHTSDQHPWFLESSECLNNDKADWYVWADPNPNNPGNLPNNWCSVFGGPAWSFCDKRKQFYMHNFLKEQPDLNFHCPDVQDAILKTAEFWLNKGVDGFRFDVINFCFHDLQLRDNPAQENKEHFATQLELEEDPYNRQKHIYDKSRPEMAEFLKKLRNLSDTHPNTLLLGEIGDDDPIALANEYTKGSSGLHTAYNFSLMAGAQKELTASYVRNAIQEQGGTKDQGWPSWAFSNHDVVRSISRFYSQEINEKYHRNPAKMLLSLICTLRGSIFLFQGEELGLYEAKIPEDITPDQMQDPWGIALYPKAMGRDGCRTPLPWNDQEEYKGFSCKKPWLPIPASHQGLSIETQNTDSNSCLNFTRDFLAWRHKYSAFFQGDIDFYNAEDEKLLVFIRSDKQYAFLCVFNLSPEEKQLKLGENKLIAILKSKDPNILHSKKSAEDDDSALEESILIHPVEDCQALQCFENNKKLQNAPIEEETSFMLSLTPYSAFFASLEIK